MVVTLTGPGIFDAIDCSTASATPVGGGILNINGLVGSAAGTGDTLIGGGNGLWTINASGSNVFQETQSGRSLLFSGFENLTGGSGNDTFKFNNAATVTGAIDGGAGLDTIDWSAYTSNLNVGITGFGTIDGFRGTEASIAGGFNNINGLIGGTGTNGIKENGISPSGTFTFGNPSTYTNSGQTLSPVNFLQVLPPNNVTLLKSSGYLFMNGDALANAIVLDQPTAGTVRVRAGAIGTTFTVGGVAGQTGPFTFTGLTNLNINLGNGDNSLGFDLSVFPFNFSGTIGVIEGTGKQQMVTAVDPFGLNRLTLTSALTYTASTSTANLLAMTNLSAVSMNWQMAGTSTVTLDGAQIGIGHGTQILTGAGADSVSIQNANFGAELTVNTGAGDDTVNVQTVAGTSSFASQTKFLLGAGVDVFNVVSVAAATVLFKGTLTPYLAG